MKKLGYVFLIATIFSFSQAVFAKKKPVFDSAQTSEIKTIVRNYLQTDEGEKIIHDYLIKNPKVLIEVSKKLEEQEQIEQKEKIENIKANIPKYKDQIFDTKAPGRIVLGNPNGKIIIAEFTQHQCPHCKETHLTLHKLLKQNPDIKLIVIYWPFFGKDSIFSAKAVLAAQKQNQEEALNQTLFDQKEFVDKSKTTLIMQSIPALNVEKAAQDINDKKISAGLKANFELAQKIGLDGTPALIFTNDKMTKFSFLPGRTENFDDDLKKALNDVKK